MKRVDPDRHRLAAQRDPGDVFRFFPAAATRTASPPDVPAPVLADELIAEATARAGDATIRPLIDVVDCLTGTPDAPALITRSRSDHQKRNRAFAAEFLVPAEQLRGRIHHPVITNETIDDLADRFSAATAVIRHQIDNHHLATVVD